MKSTSTGLFFVSILFSLYSCSFSQKVSRNLLSKAASEPYDIIVIPGVPFENPKWDSTMKGRVYWSKYLYDKGIAKNVMYSGSSVYSPYYEGIIMALYAEALGIPKEHIFYEIKAEHSTENIFYSYKKSKQLGFKRIALASDPFQTKMLKRYSRKVLDSSVGLIPMVIDSLNAAYPVKTDPKIDPQSAYNPNFKPIMEREKFWKRFKGTRGKNVDMKAYE